MFKHKISERLKLLNKFKGRFILPDYIDLTDDKPTFLFPYHEETDIRNAILEDEHRLQISFQLMESFETLHHISSVGFGIWGINELLISDKLGILPPLWVNYSQESLKFIKDSSDTFIAPEILEGKSPTPASDTYIIGKVLEILLPGNFSSKIRKILDLMTDPNPNKRPTHFSRLFSLNDFNLKKSKLVTAVRREFILPHIIERDRELSTFMNFFSGCNDKGVSSFFVKGNTRVGKSTFLSLVQKELRNIGWKTINSSNVKQLAQELLQLTETSESSGVELEDFNYIWNLGNTYNLERIISIMGKLLSQTGNLAIFIDDFELIDEKYLQILNKVQEMILNSKIIIVASSVEEEKTFKFNDSITLQPFNKEQSVKLLELLLGYNFVNNYSEKIEWIFKITGGYPGYIFNLLKLLNNAGNLTIEDGYWKLEGETTHVAGFGDYVKNIFENLNDKEKEFLFVVSCLSEKFKYDDFLNLIKILNLDEFDYDNLFLQFQKKGLIYKENSIYRFSLKDIWQVSYDMCPDKIKEYIHRTIASDSNDLSVKAWHFKCIGLVRSAANVYIQASRKAFRKNESTQLARRYLEEAFSLLNESDISLTMKAYRTFFFHLNYETCPEEYIYLFKRSEKYFHLYLEDLYIGKKLDKLISSYDDKFDSEFVKNRCNNTCYSWATYYYALAFSDLGKIDTSLNIAKSLAESLEPLKSYHFKRLKIRVNNLISLIFMRKNHMSKAYTISEKNIVMAEKNEIYSLIPDLYFTAGKIMNVYGPVYAQPLLKKSIEYSCKYFSDSNSVNAILELASNYLYSGEINKMFECLEKSREICRIFNKKDTLAESYLIEGMYHSYNRQLNEAIEDFEKADSLLTDVYLKGRAARLMATAYLLCGNFDEFEKIQKKNIPAFTEHGFSDVINIYNATTEKDLLTHFNKLKNNNQLWIEEVAVSFIDKLSFYFPAEYEAFLENRAVFNLKSHQKLSLAMIYEAMAYFYNLRGFKRKSIKFARNAYEMYKKMNFNNICNILDEKILKSEESVEDLLKIVSMNLNSKKTSLELLSKVFKKIESKYITQKNETEVLHEIINFSKTINAFANPENILEEFTNWIASVVPVSKVILLVAEEDRVVYSSYPMIKKSEYEQALPTILEMKPQYIRKPFEIKIEFFIDNIHKIILYIYNPKLLLNSEEFDKIALFTENLEPILSMAIRNSISYKTSILDPLTKLYTRWYYTQRLNEEYEKSLRLSSSISVIMADIDNFKAVNDSHGHKVGDEVLKEVAKIIKQQTRNYDIAGRYGGEEFLIILPNTSASDSLIIAERIRESIQGIDKFNFNFTCSFGVSSTEKKNYKDAQFIVTDADKALYVSKNEGKNRVTPFWSIKD